MRYVIARKNTAHETSYLSVEVDHADPQNGVLGGYWVSSLEKATMFSEAAAKPLERSGWGTASMVSMTPMTWAVCTDETSLPPEADDPDQYMDDDPSGGPP